MIEDVKPDNADMICSVVEAALKNLERGVVKDYRENYNLDSGAFRQEFGTVKIQMARRMGHTTAAIRLLFANDDAILYVRNGSAMRGIREHVDNLSKLYVVRADMMKRVFIVGDRSTARRIEPVQNRSMVIIDGASTITAHDKINIVDTFKNVRLVVELQ